MKAPHTQPVRGQLRLREPRPLPADSFRVVALVFALVFAIFGFIYVVATTVIALLRGLGIGAP